MINLYPTEIKSIADLWIRMNGLILDVIQYKKGMIVPIC